ncbi:MAG: sigma 54-interacting transcriptional regulator [Deltaproteobacteria bacterium]|nr:sigma 54-interacting transcriptional regulator [Deltaproteobacteria bacterium]
MQQTGTRQQACVGRESELTRLGELYRAASRDGERLALLVGPTGIGKSAILQEFRGRIRLDGGVVVEGRCEPGRAFGPFAEVVDRSLRFLDEVGRTPTIDLSDLSCQGQCHQLWFQHTGAGPGATEVSLEVGDSIFAPSTQDVAAVEKRLRFFDAIRGLLRDVANVRAPVVMLHDLERADRGTMQLLTSLLDGSGPWADEVSPERQLRALFVVSVRSGVVAHSDAIGQLGRHAAAESIEVGQLDVEGVRAYLQSPETVRRVIERTGGNPEAIDLLLDGDPLTAEVRLERRISSLTPGTRALVEALMVLERPTDLERLARVAGAAPSREAQRELDASEFVTRSIVDGAILFAFAREGDRELGYQDLDEVRRQELHSRCTNEYLREAGSEEDAAKHALAAGDTKRLVPLALDAARSLSASHAQDEAAALLELVVAQCPDAPIELREQLSELYRAAGDYKQGLTHGEAVRAAAPHSPAATRRVGELLTLAGSLDDAAEVLESARQLAAAEGGPEAVTEVEALLGELHYQRASYDEARQWAQKALADAEDRGELMLVLHARNTLGKLALVQRDAASAAELFEENRALAADAGLGHQEAQALTNLGVARLRRQQLAAAETAFENAITVASGVNDTRDRAIATENLAVLAHLRRDYARAQTYYHEAVTLLKHLGNRAMLARVAINLGELYLSLGEHSRARTLCEFSAHMGGVTLPPSVRGEELVLRGRIDAASGDTAKARVSFEAAVDIYARLGEARVADAMLELARVALSNGDVKRAKAILAELPAQESPKNAAEVALLAVDVERAAGGQTLGMAERAAELAEIADDDELLLPATQRLARALCDEGRLEEATDALQRAERIDARLAKHVPEEALGGWSKRPARTGLAAVQAQLAAAWNQSRDSAPPPPPRRPSSTPPHRAIDRRRARWRKAYPDLVGSSEAMGTVLAMLDKVAPTDALALIRGESGTGKELIAEALHHNSARKKRPFIKVNCAALVETLLLSELFGHERGAFTGASARKKGRFELAAGGTIFLDEIGDISPKAQVALLRVVQEREFERVGGTRPIKVDVRIIAATHRDLEAMVQEGTFREDLYYRLRGVMLEMPPLRRHLDDLPDLAERLLSRIATERCEPPKIMSQPVLELLAAHRWPGNVRELENVLRSATLFADSPVLSPEDFAAFGEIFRSADLEEQPRKSPESAPYAVASVDFEDMVYDHIRGGDHSLLEIKKVIERECIVRAMADSGGNITRAATLLGMKRPRLSQLVKQYGLNTNTGEA